MKILIATGIFPPDVGGPAQYAKNLYEEFLRRGHAVKVLSYNTEKCLPSGLRHLWYFFRVIFVLPGADFILSLDTFSAGLPAVLAAKIFGKKIIVRLGGDFLWESYTEATGNLLTLNDFYAKMPGLPLKQRIIFTLSKFVLRNSSALAFSTSWQRDIFIKPYGLGDSKLFVVENYYGQKMESRGFSKKNFLWAGRSLKLQNVNLLKDAFEDVKKENPDIKLDIFEKISRDDLFEKIKDCYAVILPSISDISPNFVLEALQYSKPVILTEETGFYKKLKDVVVFVDPQSPDDIKNKILFLADEENYRDYLQRVANFNFEHSWQEIAEEFLSVAQKA